VCYGRQLWPRRDGEDVKREVICNREEEKKRQEQAKFCYVVDQWRSSVG